MAGCLLVELGRMCQIATHGMIYLIADYLEYSPRLYLSLSLSLTLPLPLTPLGCLVILGLDLPKNEMATK